MSEKLFIGQQTLHIPHLTPGEGPRLSKGLSQARIGAVPANSIKENEGLGAYSGALAGIRGSAGKVVGMYLTLWAKPCQIGFYLLLQPIRHTGTPVQKHRQAKRAVSERPLGRSRTESGSH